MDELQKLGLRFFELRQRIISDIDVARGTYEAINLIKKIFGHDKRVQVYITAELKKHEIHDLDREWHKLESPKDKLISSKIATAQKIWPSHYFVPFHNLHDETLAQPYGFKPDINKDPIILSHLKANTEPDSQVFLLGKWFLNNYSSANDEEKIEKLRQIIKILEEKVESLEKDKSIVHASFEQSFTIEQQVLHELKHSIEFLHGPLIGGYGEPYAYAVECVGHTYKENFIFTDDTLNRTLKWLQYRLQVPGEFRHGKYVFYPIAYLFAMILLTDSAARKEGNSINVHLIDKAQQTRSPHELHRLALEGCNNINTGFIRERLEQSIKELPDTFRGWDDILEQEVLAAIETSMNLTGPELEKANSMQELISIMLHKSVDAIAKIEFLEMIGNKTKALEYRKKLLAQMEKTVMAKFGDRKEQEDAKKSEIEFIDSLESFICDEEAYLKQLVTALQSVKYWH